MKATDRLLGIVGGAMVVGAVLLLLLGGERDTGAAPDIATAPALEMVSPSQGDSVRGPLLVVFRVPGEMEMRPGGWGVGDYHVHLALDGVELMPAAADIERLGEWEYRWTVGMPAPGSHTLRLLWSGLDHRPIEETATPPVRVEVR